MANKPDGSFDFNSLGSKRTIVSDFARKNGLLEEGKEFSDLEWGVFEHTLNGATAAALSNEPNFKGKPTPTGADRAHAYLEETLGTITDEKGNRLPADTIQKCIKSYDEYAAYTDAYPDAKTYWEEQKKLAATPSAPLPSTPTVPEQKKEKRPGDDLMMAARDPEPKPDDGTKTAVVGATAATAAGAAATAAPTPDGHKGLLDKVADKGKDLWAQIQENGLKQTLMESQLGMKMMSFFSEILMPIVKAIVGKIAGFVGKIAGFSGIKENPLFAKASTKQDAKLHDPKPDGIEPPPAPKKGVELTTEQEATARVEEPKEMPTLTAKTEAPAPAYRAGAEAQDIEKGRDPSPHGRNLHTLTVEAAGVDTSVGDDSNITMEDAKTPLAKTSALSGRQQGQHFKKMLGGPSPFGEGMA